MVSHLSNRYAREAWVPSVSIQGMQARKLEWKNKKQKQRQKKKQQQQQKQQKCLLRRLCQVKKIFIVSWVISLK